MTHIGMDLQDVDLSLTLGGNRATLARRHGQGVTFPVTELENLLDRLRIANELYVVTESLCGPLEDTTPVVVVPVVEAKAPRPTVEARAPRPARLPRRAPAPEPVAARPELAKPVLVESTDEAETWLVSNTVRRRRRLTEPGTRPFGAAADSAPLARRDPTPSPFASPLRAVPSTPAPGPAATAPAASAPPVKAIAPATIAPVEAAPAAQPAAAPPRPETQRPPAIEAPPAERTMPYVPSLPKSVTRTAPQITDVMVHFLKHAGPATLDEAVRYVKSLRLWPAAMNLRLSVTIALQKSSCGFSKLPDGRYELDPEAP